MRSDQRHKVRLTRCGTDLPATNHRGIDRRLEPWMYYVLQLIQLLWRWPSEMPTAQSFLRLVQLRRCRRVKAGRGRRRFEYTSSRMWCSSSAPKSISDLHAFRLSAGSWPTSPCPSMHLKSCPLSWDPPSRLGTQPWTCSCPRTRQSHSSSSSSRTMRHPLNNHSWSMVLIPSRYQRGDRPPSETLRPV